MKLIHSYLFSIKLYKNYNLKYDKVFRNHYQHFFNTRLKLLHAYLPTLEVKKVGQPRKLKTVGEK